jgi:hypothetical protein
VKNDEEDDKMTSRFKKAKKIQQEAIKAVKLVDDFSSVLKHEMLLDAGDRERGHGVEVFIQGENVELFLVSYAEGKTATDARVKIPIMKSFPLEQFLEEFFISYAWREE